jgi:hypothetical protein
VGVHFPNISKLELSNFKIGKYVFIYTGRTSIQVPPSHNRILEMKSIKIKRVCLCCDKRVQAYCAYCGVACKQNNCICECVFYCNKKCQNMHWPEHKKVCASMVESFETYTVPHTSILKLLPPFTPFTVEDSDTECIRSIRICGIRPIEISINIGEDIDKISLHVVRNDVTDMVVMTLFRNKRNDDGNVDIHVWKDIYNFDRLASVIKSTVDALSKFSNANIHMWQGIVSNAQRML